MTAEDVWATFWVTDILYIFISFFLSSLGSGNLVELRNFFISLGAKWQDVAKYLGFSAEEIEELVHPQPDHTEIQVM